MQTEWASALGRSNNCGGACWSMVEFSLAELPGNNFAADRTLTVNIAIPAAVSYSDVTFSDARIYLIGLDTTEDFTIKFVKRGTSKLLDGDGKVWRRPARRSHACLERCLRRVRSVRQVWTFTHMDTTPAFRFGYHTDTCEPTVHLVAGSRGAQLCDTDSTYMSYSPYGLWNLEILGDALDLSAVTAVRFAFQARSHRPRTHKERITRS
jgi:hypothetical protein